MVPRKIEAVTFGTNHQVGVGSIVERFRAWIPRKLQPFFQAKVPKSKIVRDEDVLVIWVRTIDATFRTNVDCQGVRLELRDSQGTVHGEHQPNWFGYDKFWRVEHVFTVFPRHEETFDLTIVSWRGTNSVQLSLQNPHVTRAADWKGEVPPVRKKAGEFELVLTGLTAVTNAGEYWKSPGAQWEPQVEMWRDGKQVVDGWDFEWSAEDPWGNHGQQLGLNKPVLKFFTTFYPRATNLNAAVLLTNTPTVMVGAQSNQLWEASAMLTTNQLHILGFFPAGVHTFGGGEYLTNPPVKFGPIRGGAPSGWVSSSRSTPLGIKRFHGHYSVVPVIYVRGVNPRSKQRIAMRLRDMDSGSLFIATPEEQGAADTVLPFLVRLPPEVKRVHAELVSLPALSAEFLVKTKVTP